METIIRSARTDVSTRLLGQHPPEPRQQATTVTAETVSREPTLLPTREQTLDVLRQEVEAELRKSMADEVAHAFANAREKGHEKGFAEGYSKGMEQAAAESQKQREQLYATARKLGSDLNNKVDHALDVLQESVTTLSFEAICRVLGQYACERDSIKGIIGSVLADVRAHGLLTVRLHPDDLRQLTSEDTSEAFHVPGRTLEFVADESLTHGGCIIDTSAGHFDGALDIQLKRLHQALTTARTQPHGTTDA